MIWYFSLCIYYINICISIFAKHHTFITCEYILSFCLFFFVFTYTGLLIFFCYKLVLMFFSSFFMSGMKFRQTDMFCACNDDQRRHVWHMCDLSSFCLFFFLCSSRLLFSFFLYVDCSSYFMYKIRYVLDKRKEFILARKMSKWDYYYYYCLVSVNI